MTVRAIKKFFKTSDQDWSGIYINTKRLSSTKSSVAPDPRDDLNVFSNTEVRIIKDNIKENINNAVGYEGWDREYVGDNELRLIYYFSDRISANTFIHAFPTPNKNVRETFVSTILNKTKNYYRAEWVLIDENGLEETITINSN